jgi:hypothetical protein
MASRATSSASRTSSGASAPRRQLLQGRGGLMQRLAQFRLAHPGKFLRLADDRARHVEGDIAAADDDDLAARAKPGSRG